jgi:peptidoglycan/xylan/chitin deacetylase (PgdA/CDA1 family)
MVRSMLRRASQAWSRLPWRPKAALTVLAYPRVGEDPHAIPPEQFDRHLGLLYANREEIPVVDLSDGLTEVLTGEADARRVAVTFDGAWATVRTDALQPLLQHRVPATVFVSSGLLGSSTYLDRAGLRDLAGAGVSVGGHTRTSTDVRRCDDDELRDEVQGGKAELEDLLGSAVSAFAYPSGHVDGRVRQAVIDAGYAIAVTNRPGSATPGSDAFAVRRHVVGPQLDDAVFMATVRGGMDFARLLPGSLQG